MNFFNSCRLSCLFYDAVIRIAQVYSLFRRLMLASSAQSPWDIQGDQIAAGFGISYSVLIDVAVQQLVFVRLVIVVEWICP